MRSREEVLAGKRKFGCDMCDRGARMLEYIDELEEAVTLLQEEVDGARAALKYGATGTKSETQTKREETDEGTD